MEAKWSEKNEKETGYTSSTGKHWRCTRVYADVNRGRTKTDKDGRGRKRPELRLHIPGKYPVIRQGARNDTYCVEDEPQPPDPDPSFDHYRRETGERTGC